MEHKLYNGKDNEIREEMKIENGEIWQLSGEILVMVVVQDGGIDVVINLGCLAISKRLGTFKLV